MIWTSLSAALLALCVAAGPAHAALFDDLGGEAGIARIVDRAADSFLADHRIAATFDGTDLDRFRQLLASQLCQLSGGPCVYDGRDMTASHRGLRISQAQFNAVAEDLQDAMEAQGVPYHAQNRLLALLAPMHRTVVTR